MAQGCHTIMLSLDSLFEPKPHIITAQQVEIEDLTFERDIFLNAFIDYMIDKAFIQIKESRHD